MNTSFDIGPSASAPRFVMTQFTVDEFFAFWPQLETMLDAVPHTWRRWTKDHICRTVAGELTQVWGIGRPPSATLILLTMITIHPSMRVLTIVWAGGHLEEGMLPLIDSTFDGYAHLNGCEEIEIRGRSGWVRMLKGLGYRRDSVNISRRVKAHSLN